ncbi:hypothetical protein AKO1_007789 [Acrasis kona]|uniref:Uncharacterized protein n=1 Tax=Acrasis kona TaxID=1008807 RepID=A0AAW2YR65_9EUKA
MGDVFNSREQYEGLIKRHKDELEAVNQEHVEELDNVTRMFVKKKEDLQKQHAAQLEMIQILAKVNGDDTSYMNPYSEHGQKIHWFSENT